MGARSAPPRRNSRADHASVFVENIVALCNGAFSVYKYLLHRAYYVRLAEQRMRLRLFYYLYSTLLPFLSLSLLSFFLINPSSRLADCSYT